MPQGSCLGPWLYLTYAGTLFDVIPPTKSVYGFADDHIASQRFRQISLTSEHNTNKQLEDSAVIINDWVNANKLKMNTAKTEFIMFGSKAQLGKCPTKEIDIVGDKIPNVSVIRYLGAYLDEGLKFSTHVKTKGRTVM